MGAAGDLGLWASRQDPHSGIFGNQLIRKWALLLPARNRASSSISSVDHTCPLVGKVVSHHYLTGIVVRVTVSLSLRISPRSVSESNAVMRTEDTSVAF